MELTKNRGQTTNHQNRMFVLAQLRRKPFVGGERFAPYQLFLERCSENPSKHNRLQQPTEIYLVVQHIPNMSSCLWKTWKMFLVTANQISKMFVRKLHHRLSWDSSHLQGSAAQFLIHSAGASHGMLRFSQSTPSAIYQTDHLQMDVWHPTWRNSPCVMVTIWCSHEHLQFISIYEGFSASHVGITEFHFQQVWLWHVLLLTTIPLSKSRKITRAG